MILIVTHKEDYTVDYVANKLNKLNAPFFRLNTDALNSLDFEITANKKMCVCIKDIHKFHSLWYRRVKFPDIPTIDSFTNDFLSRDYESLLYNFISTIKFKKNLSNPYKIFQAENKIFQLSKAVSLGLKIPKTIVTSSKEQIINFLDHSDKSIIKPIRSGRLNTSSDFKLMYTSPIKSEHLHLAQDSFITPFIIQEEIEKKYEIRVTVVNNMVFSAKVNSQVDFETKIDWRKKRLSFVRCKIPSSIEEACVNLVKSLGLKFGAIDLALSKKGEYFFFEINPNGQWVWIELDTKLPISNELIKYLTK